MSGYVDFAWFYDSLTDNVEYDKIASAIDEYVEKFGGTKDILLDLACGTGTLSERLANMGYDVIGVDSSEQMLNLALNKKYDNNSLVQYVCQDMTKLDLYGGVDVTVCVLDSINHLKNIEEVEKTFEKVSLFTNPNGLFIFDVNTIYKHKNILAENAFIYDMEDVFCTWQNEYYDDDNSVGIFLDFFEKTEDGKYTRSQESFIEQAYNQDDIKKLIVKAGFEILEEYDDYSDKSPTEFTQRIVYVVKKV